MKYKIPIPKEEMKKPNKRLSSERIKISKYKCNNCKQQAVSFISCKPYCQECFDKNRKPKTKPTKYSRGLKEDTP